VDIFAIDPGNEFSAYSILRDCKLVDFGKIKNEDLFSHLRLRCRDHDPYKQNGENVNFAIEMVACYGMAVGKEVFETCVWIGRFDQYIRTNYFVVPERIYRTEVKMNMCHDSRAKDKNIRQAVIDRLGPQGTKKNPGATYGVSADVWQAVAVGITYLDWRNGEFTRKTN
jgi:hypothetical protein